MSTTTTTNNGSAIGAFTIDDDFNPLQDMNIDTDDEQGYDYAMPIPDAELSRMPIVVPQTDEERIDHLIEGIPGAHFRLLRPVAFCTEPQTATDIIADLDSSFPQGTSVYAAAQIIKLLQEAGALQLVNAASDDDASADASASTTDAATAAIDGDKQQDASSQNEYLTVSKAPASIYLATEAGTAALDKYCGEHLGFDVINEEQRYLPIYKTILEMTAADGGAATKAMDAIIDIDPLLEEPRRFCGYFLGRLEKSGAIRWGKSWTATELGKKMLDSITLTSTGASTSTATLSL